MGRFPLHYYRKLGRYLREEAEMQRKAMDEASKDPNQLEFDFDAERITGEAT